MFARSSCDFGFYLFIFFLLHTFPTVHNGIPFTGGATKCPVIMLMAKGCSLLHAWLQLVAIMNVSNGEKKVCIVGK